MIQLLADAEAYHSAAVAAYAAIPVDVATGLRPAQTMEQLWEFWRTHLLILPNWWCIAKRVGIMLSSSACAERLFAMYTSMFNAQQHACLEDRIEFAVTRKFNHNQRANMEEARLHA